MTLHIVPLASLSTLSFFFNHPATTEIYTLSLHDALPICAAAGAACHDCCGIHGEDAVSAVAGVFARRGDRRRQARLGDRKSTRLNSSHEWISYAVFCLKKKKKKTNTYKYYDNTN